MIKYRCPHCSQKLGVPDEYAGRRVRCSKCGRPSIAPRKIVPVAQPSSGVSQDKVPVAKVAKTATAAEPVAGASPPSAAAKPAPSAGPEPAPVPPPAHSESVTRMPDELQLVPDDEFPEIVEDPNAAILRQARASRAHKIDLKIPSGRKSDRRSHKAKSPKPDRTEERGGFSLIPDVLRTPLAFILAFGLVGGLILTWIAVARAADTSMSFFAALIPLAGAAGLRLMPNRGAAVGFLAVILGIVGVGAGKAAMAKWGMIPMLRKQANEEVLENLSVLLNDKRYQIPPDQSAEGIIRSGNCMMCVALAYLVDQEGADPRQARSLAIELFRSSGAMTFTDFVSNIGASDASADSRMEAMGKKMKGNELYEKAASVMWTWEDPDALKMARKYYPAYARLAGQAQILHNLENTDDLFKFAFIASLSALDIIWIALGIGGAFVITSLD